ncbi:hypothetical protein MUY35_11305 [Aliiroseovarius sp. S1339]|uniref:hypothetical protein n=1 Tax=Aliiroseovarius sp. S1339 TaxID=2936990 RepID=UPI0020BEF747|nr:hypothetical protein [Aliiroseovarius sp. S1339]MCK8464441.1 hypothetical protein [Aliiroseovarius sp. S1339]
MLPLLATPLLAKDCGSLLKEAPLKGLIEARESFDARDINESRFRKTLLTLVGTDCDGSSLEPYFKESGWLFLGEVFAPANIRLIKPSAFVSHPKAFCAVSYSEKNAVCS